MYQSKVLPVFIFITALIPGSRFCFFFFPFVSVLVHSVGFYRRTG